MSHNPHLAPVPFKLSFGIDAELEYEGDKTDKYDIAVLPADAGTANLRDLYRAYSTHLEANVIPEPIVGWQMVPKDDLRDYNKKYVGITGYKFVKGKHVVWFINESQYEHVGYADPCFIAFDKDSIEAIKADMAGGYVKTDTTVTDWW